MSPLSTAERVLSWIALVALAFFTFNVNASYDSMADDVAVAKVRSAHASLDVEVYPAIPEAFAEAWAEVGFAPGNLRNDNFVWLTVSVRNDGPGLVRDVGLKVEATPVLHEIYGMTADGLPLRGHSYGRSLVAAGGEGMNNVTIAFDDELGIGSHHVVFLGLQPDVLGATPYNGEDFGRWLDTYRRSWTTIEASAVGPDGNEVTDRAIGYAAG